MRIAYLDCSCGISGDMTVAALVDAGVGFDRIRAGIDSLGLPGVNISIADVQRCGFRAKHLKVEHPEQHGHRHLRDIVQLIDRAPAISTPQKALATKIFSAIAEAEAKVHGSSIERVHFHEVGAIDSIVDIVAAAIGFDLLGADEIVASAVPTGRGRVRIAHGECPVPTPGTAELLKGIPLVDVPVDAELTTPTGAAILRSVVGRFGALPAMAIEQLGYGAGTKDFSDRANVLRLIVGTGSDAPAGDTVFVIETNLDDVPAEIIGYTQHKLLHAGALDVYTTAIQMKKNRPGVLLSVLARPEDIERLKSILFTETGTFGIRRYAVERSKRDRAACTVATDWGPVAGKVGSFGGKQVFSAEYESCIRVATQFNVPLRDVYRAAEAAFAANPQACMPAASLKPAIARSADGVEHLRDHDHSHDHDHHH